VLSIAPAYPVLLLAGLLAGVGNSVFHPADFSLLNRKLPTARLGHAFAVHGVSGAIGWAAAPILVTALAATEGWRVAALSASLVALSGIALVLWRNDSTREAAPVRQQTHADAKPDGALAFLAVPEVWMCFAFFLAASTAFGALQSYLPTALDHGFGMPVTVAALAMSAFLLGTAFGTAAGGFVAGGRFGQDRVIAAALAFAAMLAVLLAGGAMPQWAVAPMLGAIGFATGMAGPSRDLLVRRAAAARFAQAAYGRIYGFVYSGLDAGMACAPLLFGPLMDAGHFHWLLSGVALLQVLAVFTALGIGSRNHPA
jgi:predicted MFS family arabinose efflux permease